MSTDRDVTTRIVRSWLHEDAHEDADRILNLVLDEIDTTPQRRPGWLARRFPPMNSTTRIALSPYSPGFDAPICSTAMPVMTPMTPTTIISSVRL